MIDRNKGIINTKLTPSVIAKGAHPTSWHRGQVSDYIGARALLSSLPEIDWLLGDRGYDAD